MKKMILVVCFVIVCTSILAGILLADAPFFGTHAVDMEPFREKYARYANIISSYDDKIFISGTNGNYIEGSCWQCYNFSLSGLCYNFLFECNIYGDESLRIELSKVTSEVPNMEELSLFITICKDMSKKDFSEALIREKCEYALKTGTGRLSKEYYFEVDEYGTLSFYGCPK